MSTNSGERGSWEPLDSAKREIRFLRLLETQDAGTDTCIYFEQRTFSLNDSPNFKALSYCWTKAKACKTICVNGRPLQVRPNLYAYLKIMRNELDFDWVFIDAICINQQDLAERSAQVSIMGSVYHSARLVVAWLGNCDNLPQESLKAAREICDASPRALSSMSKGSKESRDFVEAFTSSDYWSRLWIVPEVTMARDILFRRGSLKADAARLFRFYAAVFHLDEHTYSARATGPQGLAWFSRNWVYYSLLRQKSEECRNASGFKPRPIANILGTYPRQECTIGRDKIYGLLGLSTSICEVDYSSPSITVYLQLLAENLLTEPSRMNEETITQFIQRTNFLAVTLSSVGLSITRPSVLVQTWMTAVLCGFDEQRMWVLTLAIAGRPPSKHWFQKRLELARQRVLREYYRQLWKLVANLPYTPNSLPKRAKKELQQWNEKTASIVADVQTRLRQVGQASGDASGSGSRCSTSTCARAPRSTTTPALPVYPQALASNVPTDPVVRSGLQGRGLWQIGMLSKEKPTGFPKRKRPNDLRNNVQ